MFYKFVKMSFTFFFVKENYYFTAGSQNNRNKVMGKNFL